MPTETPSPTEPQSEAPREPATGFAGSPAPLSFVPHGTAAPTPLNTKISTGRYGELEHHELIHLLDSIEDERARGRFRESIYISVFFWILVAWVVLYGPRYLWHAPQLINPADVLKSRELVQLNAPTLPPSMKGRPARPAPKPTLDNKTIEHLRATAPSRSTPPPTPQPLPPTPAPNVPPPVATSPVSPRPQPAPVAEAPTPQPATRPNFNTSSNPGDVVRNAARDAAHSREGLSGGGGGGNTRFEGGVQVLSDLQGVDFTDYLRRVYNDVKRNWIPLLPEETQPPLLKQGETYVRFTILPDGSIGEMHLDGSTHDQAIDKAAWGSIVSEGQFPPLPAKFHGPKLELRYHYIVNKPIQ